MNNINEINARLNEIESEFQYLRDNYEGCDWCCGGGDEWWASNVEERSRLEERLAELMIGHPS